VAATIYYVAREVLGGTSPEFRRRYPDVSVEDVRGNLIAGRGIGWETLLSTLNDIPGINKSTITDQLANLKAAGIYASIIADALPGRNIPHAQQEPPGGDGRGEAGDGCYEYRYEWQPAGSG
jgi:hypothetical protein